jgi:UDPglucose--hexose-1-phosphate uridylyltransferase
VEVGVTVDLGGRRIIKKKIVPPIPARELQQQADHLAVHGRGLLEQIVATELEDGRRVLYRGDHVAAFIPVFARYSYEVWIATRRAAPSIAAFTDPERADFVRALKTVLLKYDGLWSKPFPYVMVIHQAPTDGRPHPEAHFHVEFYPAYRMAGRLKYLAGSELGAGVFTADTLPEEKAKELQAIEVTLS